MIGFFEKIAQHPALSKVDEIVTTIDDFQEDEVSLEALLSLHRIKRICQNFKHQVSAADTELVSLTALSTIDQNLLKIKQELVNFKKARSNAHINAAGVAADSILLHSRAFWIPIVDLDLEQLKDSIASFRKSIGQNARYAENELASLRAEVKDVNDSLRMVRKELEENKNRADSVISDLQAQFSKSEDNRRSEHNQLLKVMADELDDSKEKHTVNMSSLHKDVSDKFNALEKSLGEKANGYISEIKENKEQAESLIHVIANTGMVGGYQRVANEERSVGRFWDAVTLLSLAGMVVFAMNVFSSVLEEFSITSFIAKLGVILTFGALAGYSSKQAEKHHSVERRNRKVELELASIGPFLAELPKEDRNRVKSIVADRLFANDLSNSADGLKEIIDDKHTKAQD